MKKTCKKILALFGCLAMLAAMFVAPASAESESIVIKCIDQKSAQTDTNFLSPGIAWNYKAGGGDFGTKILTTDATVVATANFKVIVPENGWYDMEFIIASWSTKSQNAATFSKLNYWIDDGEAKLFADETINAGAPTLETLSTTPLGSDIAKQEDGSEEYTQSKLLEPVYLTAGEHTINFQTAGLHEAGLAVKVGFYSITLTPFDASGIDNQTLHAGDYSKLVKIAEDGTLGTYSCPTKVNTVNGGKYIHLSMAKDTDNAGGYKIEVPFNIYEKGAYQINLEMATYGRDTDSDKWNSPVKLKVDDGEYFTVKTFSTTAEPDVTATVVNTDFTAKYNTGGDTVNKRIADYQLVEPMILSEGEHTFSFWVYSPRITSATQFVFEFGDIGIKRMTDFSAYDSQTIHAGNYPNLELSNSGVSAGTYTTTTYANSENGGKFIHLAASGDAQGSADGFKVKVPFKVYTDGLYNINLDMLANSRPVENHGWNSPVKIKIDDNDYFRAKTYTTTDDVTVTATVVNTALAEKYSADSEKARWVEYALNPVELTAGEHTLTFWVYDKAPKQGNDWHVFGLGEINIDLIKDLSALNNITIHGGNYPCFEMRNEAGDISYVAGTTYLNVAGDGTMVSFSSKPSVTGAYDGYRVNIPFTVYNDGAYDIDLDMFAYSIYNSGDVYKWASKPMVKIDDGDYFWLKAFATTDNPHITATVLDYDLTDKYNYDDNTADEKYWAEYALNTTELTAGSHTLTIWLPEQAANQSEHDLFVLGIGEINIAPASDDATVTIEGESLIIEKISSTVAGDKYSGGRYLEVTDAGYVLKEFYIPETGSYTLQTVATDNASYIIDGTGINFGDGVDVSGTVAAGWNKYSSEVITLEKGTHTLMFNATGACALDYIRISQPLAITDIDVSDIDILSVGDSAELDVVNQDGVAVSAYDVDTMCYESSNEDVVEVDAYGNLTAVGMGKATVTVGVLVSGETITASTDVIVVGDSNLYVSDTTVSGNDVSVTLASAGNASASVVVVGVYSVENEITKLTDVKTIDFASLSANESDTQTVTMSVIGNNDNVMVFVFDGMDTMNPLWIKTIAK